MCLDGNKYVSVVCRSRVTRNEWRRSGRRRTSRGVLYSTCGPLVEWNANGLRANGFRGRVGPGRAHYLPPECSNSLWLNVTPSRVHTNTRCETRNGTERNRTEWNGTERKTRIDITERSNTQIELLLDVCLLLWLQLQLHVRRSQPLPSTALHCSVL